LIGLADFQFGNFGPFQALNRIRIGVKVHFVGLAFNRSVSCGIEP
jgi:hypothetical protein